MSNTTSKVSAMLVTINTKICHIKPVDMYISYYHTYFHICIIINEYFVRPLFILHFRNVKFINNRLYI
jgi:hypothetical protein